MIFAAASTRSCGWNSLRWNSSYLAHDGAATPVACIKCLHFAFKVKNLFAIRLLRCKPKHSLIIWTLINPRVGCLHHDGAFSKVFTCTCYFKKCLHANIHAALSTPVQQHSPIIYSVCREQTLKHSVLRPALCSCTLLDAKRIKTLWMCCSSAWSVPSAEASGEGDKR